jgi:predicted secreted protein
MALLEGKNLLVAIGDTVWGYATSCSLDITVDTEETSSTTYKQLNSAGEGSWKGFSAAKKSWTASTDHLVGVMSNFDAAFSAIVATNPEVTIKFGAVNYKTGTGDNLTHTFETGSVYTGKAVITSLNISGSTDGEATFSVSFQGTGALTKA